MAIAYDFDGTLAPGNMQEHSFLPTLKISKGKFWSKVKNEAKDHDMDEVLAYMRLMLKEAQKAEQPVTKEKIRGWGKDIELFPGVKGWFSRINSYAKKRSVRIEHYIISSGLREMIAGTTIGDKFEYIFASGFAYDEHNAACWPALAINYTTKTQYLFRINKGIKNSYDNTRINKFVAQHNRRIPFSRIIYIGDSENDVPCMKMLKFQGGHAIATYHSKKHTSKEVARKLIQNERASYAAPANYSKGGKLENLVKNLIDKIASEARLEAYNKLDAINKNTSNAAA